MKITKTTVEMAQSTDVKALALSTADQTMLEWFTNSYMMTFVVVVIIILALVIGLVVYESCRTRASTKTTRRLKPRTVSLQ